MNALLIKLLNMSAAGSVLILAVVVLRAVLKKAPRWIICLMWALVAIRLICPISISSPVSAFRATPSIVSENGEVEVFRPAGGSEKPLLAVDTVQIERPQASSETIRDIPGTSYAVTQRSRDAYLPPLVQAYLLGLTGMLLYALVSTLLLRKKVSVFLRQRGNIRVCDEVASPFILGIFRPVIYLPSSLSEEEKRFVLAHERAHLRRLDHVWKPLGFLILSVHWFNPFCWLAYVLLCRDIELACDEKVIRELGRAERAAYSQTLLNCSAHRILAACPVAFGETDVKSRVKAVLNYKKPAFWIILAAVLGCLVLVVCFAANPVGGQKSETTPPPTNEMPSTMPEDAGASAFETNEYLPLYQSVLDMYSAALKTANVEKMGDTSGLIRNFFDDNPLRRVGWSLTNLNLDAVPELVIGTVENEPFYGNILFDVYTLSDGAPVRLAQSIERDRWYSIGEWNLLEESSGSASYSKWTVWTLANGSCDFFDGLIQDGRDGEVRFFSTRWENGETVPDRELTNDEAQFWIEQHESKVSRLSFTPFDTTDWTPQTVTREDEQRALLEACRSQWAFTDPYDTPWYYTFVDLDHNGRLEVIAATTQGSGVFTRAHYYEVNADMTGIANLYQGREGQDDWPEIVVDSLSCYFDPDADCYYYPCEGITRDGAARHYYAWYALRLKNDVAEWEFIASKTMEWHGLEDATVVCQDAQGNSISERDYELAVSRRFTGMERSELHLTWYQVQNSMEAITPVQPQLTQDREHEIEWILNEISQKADPYALSEYAARQPDGVVELCTELQAYAAEHQLSVDQMRGLMLGTQTLDGAYAEGYAALLNTLYTLQPVRFVEAYFRADESVQPFLFELYGTLDPSEELAKEQIIYSTIYNNLESYLKLSWGIDYGSIAPSLADMDLHRVTEQPTEAVDWIHDVGPEWYVLVPVEANGINSNSGVLTVYIGALDRNELYVPIGTYFTQAP